MGKHYMFLLSGLALLAACQQFDDLEGVDHARYEAAYAIPLIDTRTSMRDLLENVEEGTEILIDSEGLIRFIYRGDVISQTSDDLFASINKSLPPVIPVSSPRMPLPFTGPDGLEVDRIDLKDGQLIYYFESRHADRMDVTITFPQVRREGKPLVFRQSVPPYSGTGAPPRVTNFLFPESLAGYAIVPENDSVYVEYQARHTDGRLDTLSGMLVRIQNLAFTYAEGYLGNQIHKGGRDTISIDFFDNWVRGDVYFEEPRITFNIENSFGIPTRSIVNLFNVITVRGEVLPLQSEFVKRGIDFPYPSINEVGKIKRSTFTFTKQNSNIDAILGAGPVAVDYDVDALTNPDSNTDIRGFITDSSYYRVRIEVELPLFGRAADFVARDTFDIDLAQFEGIDRAEFKLVADNELPLAIDLQAYFLDDSGAVLDSLLESRQRVVNAAPVDERGIATGPVQKVTFAPYPEGRFDRIRNARYLVLNAAFSTSGEGTVSVRPLAGQELRVRIGAIMGVKRE